MTVQNQVKRLEQALARKQKAKDKILSRDAEYTKKYPHYVKGSIRQATDEEKVRLQKDWVAECKCEMCSKVTVRTLQDVFHATLCPDCRKVAKKNRVAAKRPEDKLSEAEIRAKLAELEAKMQQAVETAEKKTTKKATKAA